MVSQLSFKTNLVSLTRCKILLSTYIYIDQSINYKNVLNKNWMGLKYLTRRYERKLFVG